MTAEVEDQAAKAIGLILLLAGAPNLHARDRMEQICAIVNMYLDMLHTVAIDDLTTGECRSAAAGAPAPVPDAVLVLTEEEYVQALMSDQGAEAAASEDRNLGGRADPEPGRSRQAGTRKPKLRR